MDKINNYTPAKTYKNKHSSSLSSTVSSSTETTTKAKITNSEPAICECARFGKRKLSWATWVKGFSSGKKGKFLDRKNIEFSHEHIVWDGSKDNIGFGTKGLYSEQVDEKKYDYDPTCYDGSLMRKAVSKVKDMGKYMFVGNNCQNYVEKVRNKYQELMSPKS